MIKRKHIFRIVLGIGLVVLILAIAGIAVLRSRAFHRYALGMMVEQASQAAGGRVEIGDFRFRWSGLRADLDHIVLHGTEAASRAPLLQVDHLAIGLKIISLWRRKIDLSEIVIDRPSIHVSVDQNGRSNLPQTPPAPPGTQLTNVFDLAIGHFVVNQGELNYNNRHIPLDGEVHDLHAQVTFDSGKTEYDGTLGYRDGRVQLGSFNPVQDSVQVRFGAAPSALTLDSLVLNAGSSTMSVQARLQDYSNPSVDGSYQVALSVGELGNILKATSFPVGQVNLQGTLHYQSRANQALLDNLSVAGGLRSPLLVVNLPQARATVRSLIGEYHLNGGTLEARNVQADVLGGRMTGGLTITHLSEQPAARVAAAVRDVSLEAVTAALNTRPLERAAISGRLNATLEGTWQGSAKNLQIRSDANISASAPVRQAAGPAPNAIPLQGAVHLAYDARSGAISLGRTELTAPHTTVKLDGSTGKQSSLGIKARSGDLREIDQLVLIARDAVRGSSQSSSKPIKPLGIGGSGSFDGQLRGSMTSLQLTGQVSSTNLQYQGTRLSELRAHVALGPSGVVLSQGQLQTSEQGQVQFDIAAGLTNWAYSPRNPVRVDLTASKVAVATLERLANLHYPITGTLAAQVSMHGSQSNLIGQGSARLAHAAVWDQPVQDLNVQFQGAGSTVQSTFQLRTPAGSGSGKLTYDFRDQGYDAQISLPRVQFERLEAVSRRNVQVTGVVTASLQGQGTLKDPQFDARIQAPKLLIGQETLDGLKLHAGVARQQATFTLDSAAAGASIEARGAVNLNSNYDATASVDVRNVQLGPLLAAFLPQTHSELHGQAEIHGSLRGPLKHREQVEAEVNIPTFNLAYQSLQIGNASPIRAVYRGGVLSLEQCELKGTGTDLQVHGTVPVEHAQNLQAMATGNIDLHLIQVLYPDWDSSGQVRLDVGAEGTLAHPAVHGTVRVVDAAFQAPGAPLGAQNVNAAFAIQNGRVDVQSFTGEAGGGTLSAQGFATYQPAVQFNVALDTQGVRLRYPQGTRAVLDSNLTLTGSSDSALLSGQVVIDRLSLTKQFDLSTFADQFSGSTPTSAGPGFAQNVRLNVSVKSASEMAVASSKLSVQGSAHLTLQGTAAEPVILGRSDITGGEIFFNGQRYEVESGVIQFVNPVRTEPVVNLLVTTTVDQFNLNLNFVGPIDRMRTTYTSDPPLAPIDIINLLTVGHTTEAAAASSTTPQSVIAGQLTSQISGRVEKLAGISSLTIDPQVGGGQSNGVGRLAVQQRVTKNLFFTFATDFTTSTGQVVQVEYQVTRRFAVSTIRDQNGGYTVQIKVHKSF